MKYAIYPFQQLNPDERMQLVSLHMLVMKTLLSELGVAIVDRYYQIIAQDTKVIGFYAMDEKVLLGWVVGSPYPQALNSRLRFDIAWLALHLLRLLFHSPYLIYQLIISSRSAGDKLVPQPGEIELTYIGVAPEVRGQKLGKTLLHTFIEKSRVTGYQKVSLSVEIYNQTAISLYQSNGFQITRSYTEGNYKRYRMVYEL